MLSPFRDVKGVYLSGVAPFSFWIIRLSSYEQMHQRISIGTLRRRAISCASLKESSLSPLILLLKFCGDISSCLASAFCVRPFSFAYLVSRFFRFSSFTFPPWGIFAITFLQIKHEFNSSCILAFLRWKARGHNQALPFAEKFLE